MAAARADDSLRRRVRLWRWIDPPLPRLAVESALMVAIALCGLFAVMVWKAALTSSSGYHFGDFFALWTSAVVTHGGDAAVNYDPDALQQRQIALGMAPGLVNPFPYPPSLLLLLDPLGALPLHAAFFTFALPAFAAFGLAMSLGRFRQWWWPLAACMAPATGVTLMAGQTGYLSGALMVAGLRLLASHQTLAGAMFGLLTFKPQLGVLVPVALAAMGAWRAFGAAAATCLALVALSGALYGFPLWLLWAKSLVDYAGRFYPVVGLMPTIYAGAILSGASRPLALALQLAAAIPVALVVWRAWRQGPSDRAIALLAAGTFLATPHAFSYDMPMSALAPVTYVAARLRGGPPLRAGELFVALLAFAAPLLIVEGKASGLPMAWIPLALMFAQLARLPPAEISR